MGLTGRIIVCHHNHVNVDDSQGDSIGNGFKVRALRQKCCRVPNACKIGLLIRLLQQQGGTKLHISVKIHSIKSLWQITLGLVIM